jgi:hypothetical protein
MLPARAPSRRSGLAALSLALAVIGAQVYASWTGGGAFFTEIWPPILLISVAPPAAGVMLHGRRAQRTVCLLGTVVVGLLALALFAYGYGICQIPAVVALASASAVHAD